MNKEINIQKCREEISALEACIELMEDQFMKLQTVNLDTAKRFEIAEKGEEYANKARERMTQIFYS